MTLLAACTASTEPQPDAEPRANAADQNEALPAPLDPPAPGEPGGLPEDREPIPEGPIDPKSAEGAGRVVQSYFALIESRRFEEARRLWAGNGEARSRDPEAFAAQFAPYAEFHANIGAPGRIEGAAGTLYVEIPIQAYGRTRDGEEFSRLGKMTLRRANDVPGATAEQLQWRIHQVSLDPAPD